MPRGRSCSISTRPRSRTSSSSAPRRPWRGSCSPSSWSSRSSSFGCSAVIRNTDVRRRVDGARVVLPAAFLGLAVSWLLPIVWVVVTSLKTTAEIVKVPPEWIPWPATGAHYHEVLLGSSRTARIGRAFANSIVVAVGTAVVVLVTSAMSAYALARLRFPGRGTVFTVLVGSLMIPNAVVLVPQYVLVQQLGWLSTFQGLIVPEAAMTFAFGVFLLRQFFLALPGELEDAARIDGASAWDIFLRIVLPLSQPVLGALAIFAFRSAWNDFLWPLIAVNKPDMFPLPVALALLRGAYAAESYGPIMAGAALSALPLLIVFLVANRRIVEASASARSRGSARHRRRPRTTDDDRLALARPRRHRHAEHRERLVAEGAELEVSAQRHGQAHARPQPHDLLAGGLAAPHLAPAAQHVPELLDGPVGDPRGHLAGPQLEFGEAAGGDAQQHPDVGAVRRDRGPVLRTVDRGERCGHGHLDLRAPA